LAAKKGEKISPFVFNKLASLIGGGYAILAPGFICQIDIPVRYVILMRIYS
jgi:hypothetical protein